MSAEKPENARPKSLEARIARGFGDREAGDIAATNRMMDKIREVYELYGFEAVETPFVEYTDCLGKFLPDQDRPNEGVFSFQDDDDQWLSLRYDLTAPLARYYAENHEKLPKPYRSYRAGWVFRNEKPGPGRFRQFMQFDADTVGAPSVAADAEICMMAADTLEALGIKRGDYVIKVNNRKVLDGVMEAIGLGGPENAGKRLIVLRAIDKLDRLGPEGVRALLGEGRKDESGDFTKGAGLAQSAIDMVLAFTAARGMSDRITLDNLERVVAASPLGVDGVNELRLIADLVGAAGYAESRIVIDPAVVRGLEYYTGPVYEAELTFQVQDEKGRPIRFGSVGGGGRYDGLVSRFLNEPAPATGFSVGVSRLLSALKAVKSPIVAEGGVKPPVIVLAMDKAPEALAGYQAMVAELRRSGIRAEMYLGGANIKQQLKYADRRGASCVVIQGSNERQAGEALVKDLILGADLSKIADRAEYLRKQAEVQFPVKATEIVAGVRKVLARRGG